MSRAESQRENCEECDHNRGGLCVVVRGGKRVRICGRCANRSDVKVKQPDASMSWGEILRIERSRKFPDRRVFATGVGVGDTTIGAWESGVEWPKGHEQHQRLRQHLPEMLRWDAKMLSEIEHAAIAVSRQMTPPTVRLVSKEETMTPQVKPDPKRNLRYLTLLMRVGKLKAAPDIVSLLEMVSEDGASCRDLAEALTGAFVEIGE